MLLLLYPQSVSPFGPGSAVLGGVLTLWPCCTVPKTTRRLHVCAQAEQKLYCVGSFARNCIVLPENKLVTSDPWRHLAV